MSAPLRFLGLAIIAYVGLRTASSALALEPIAGSPPAAALAALPPGVPADMGPPAAAYGYAPPGAYGYGPATAYAYGAGAPAMAMPPQAYAMMPYPVPTFMPAPRQNRPFYEPAPYPAPYQASYPTPSEDAPGSPMLPDVSTYAAGEAPPLDQWPAIGTAGPFSVGGLQETPSWGDKRNGAMAAARQSRWSVDAWALVRQPRSGLLSNTDPDDGLNPGLASAGSLGSSQAGLRLTWRPLPRVGVHLRASTALMPQGRGGQTLAGGEGSAGISYQPIGGLPVRLLAERRQRFGPALGGGRNAFALLAEGGIYDRELAYGIRLDGYGQAGVVGARRRDLFADGALTASYPFMPRMAIGGGMWGGVQPGLSRFDVGPRLSYQLSPRLRAHLDYRFRVTGRADPPSGPALTLSGGF